MVKRFHVNFNSKKTNVFFSHFSKKKCLLSRPVKYLNTLRFSDQTDIFLLTGLIILILTITKT